MNLDRIVTVKQQDFTKTEGIREGMTLITNPPYGERIKADDLEALYRAIGSTLKHHYPGTDAWILSSSKKALGQIGLKPSGKHLLLNGALECSYVNYKTFQGRWKDYKSSAHAGS